MADNSALIFTNGEIEDLQAVRNLIAPGDTLVAADGGMRHLAALRLLPTALVGDLDSLPAGIEGSLLAAGVEILRYPVEKDSTDLELALEWAIARGFKSIRIVGALGGRLDHTLGNLYLLTDPGLAAYDVRLDDGVEEVFLIRDQAVIQGMKGDIVSLLPLNGEAQGVQTENLYYPLRGETLFPYRTRGISNVLEEDSGSVRLTHGLLLCIHTRQKSVVSTDRPERK